MSRPLTVPQADLLAALKAALHGEPLPPEQARRLESFLPLARGHAVDFLLAVDPLPETGEGPWAELRRRGEQCVRQYYRLLTVTRRLVGLLEAEGIPAVVLKGAGAAADYPVPELRKSGDVDLLLARGEDLARAGQVLEKLGARPVEDQHARHHVEYALPDGMMAELHTAMTEPLGRRQADLALARLQGEALARRRPREVFPRVALPLLPPGGQALSLLLHMLSHFRGSGFGLKLLCDWTVFWEQPVPREELDWYLKGVKALGLTAFCAGLTGVCVDRLGLSPEKAAPLLALAPVSPEPRAALLEEILTAQEFGKQAGDRLVAVQGRGLAGYARELHRQTRRNFPRGSKLPLLWPGLWAASGVRFLRNNKKRRGVPTAQVLRTASRRGELARRLKLFEDR